MKIRRAIGFSVLAYIMTMIVGIAVSAIAGIDMTDPNAIMPVWCWVVSCIAAVGFTALMAHFYFNSMKVVKTAQQGFYFGITAVIVGFILDIITLVPTFGWEALTQYYLMPIFPITLALILIVTALVGKRKARH